jgi:hypothetical protein
MERAMKIAKQRAEIPVLGKSPLKPSSITSFTHDHIIDNASLLGVSLGNSHSECAASARLIKDVEIQRNITILKKLYSLINDTTSCLVVTHASELCLDLEGEDYLDDEPLVVPKERKVRKKKIDNNAVRRSNRVRFKNTKYQ